MAVTKAWRKGYVNERWAMKRLKNEGYYCIRSAGSHGLFDIIAISENLIRLIQFKTNCWPSPADVEALREFKAPGNVSKEIWRKDDYDREPKVRYLNV